MVKRFFKRLDNKLDQWSLQRLKQMQLVASCSVGLWALTVVYVFYFYLQGRIEIALSLATVALCGCVISGFVIVRLAAAIRRKIFPPPPPGGKARADPLPGFLFYEDCVIVYMAERSDNALKT